MSVEVRQKAISKGRKSLYLDIYESGSRNYEFLKLYLLPVTSTENRQSNKETLKLADAIRAKREIELKNEEYGFTAGFKKKANFIEYFAVYRDSRKNKGTRDLLSNAEYHLKEFAGDVLPFSAITPQWIEKFKTYLLNASSLNERKRKHIKDKPVPKIGAQTARTYFNCVQSAYYHAVKSKIITQNPFAGIDKIAVPDANIEYLELHELEQLLKTDCKRIHVKRAFLFACFTGLRISDIRALTWGNINNDEIILQQLKTKNKVIVPLSETAKELLPQRGNDSEHVFKNLTKKIIEINLASWGIAAGIKKRLTFHVSRHTFGTLSITSGNDLYTVKELLGHKRIETTQIYAKIINAKRKQAVQLLPTLELPESLKVKGSAA